MKIPRHAPIFKNHPSTMNWNLYQFRKIFYYVTNKTFREVSFDHTWVIFCTGESTVEAIWLSVSSYLNQLNNTELPFYHYLILINILNWGKAGCILFFQLFSKWQWKKIKVCSTGGVEGGLFEQMTLPLLTWPYSNAACQVTYHRLAN